MSYQANQYNNDNYRTIHFKSTDLKESLWSKMIKETKIGEWRSVEYIPWRLLRRKTSVRLGFCQFIGGSSFAF